MSKENRAGVSAITLTGC